MPAIASGGTATFTVAAGDYVRVTTGPSGFAALEAVSSPGLASGERRWTRINGRQVFGPWQAGTVRINALADSVDYEFGAQVNTDDADRPALWSDASGTALVRPDGSFAGLGGGLASGSTTAAIQAALVSGSTVSLAAGVYNWTAPLLVGSDTELILESGVVMNGAAPVQTNFLRTGNADYDGNTGIAGVTVLCATERATRGVGTLTYTHSGTTLTYAAPGDVAGSPVNIGSVTTPNTSNNFTVVSGNGVDMLHVVVCNTSSRTANDNKTVRIEPVTGSRAITWVRNGTTLVATESGHTRRVGDFVMVMGGARRQGYIIDATATTWTIADPTGASSGSAEAFGVRNIVVRATGAKIVGNHAATPNANLRNMDHAYLIFGLTTGTFELGQVEDFQKYCFFVSGGADIKVSGIKAMTNNVSDTVHLCGPMRRIEITDISARAIDNIIGIGCCDYTIYNLFYPGNGTIDVEDYTVDNVYALNTTFEPIRLYNANSGVLRRGRIRKLTGTYDQATTAGAFRVISDLNVEQVDAGATNIEGLEVDQIDAVSQASNSMTPAVIFAGTGTRRGIKLRNIRLRPSGNSATGTIVLDSAAEDVTVLDLLDGGSGFSGAAVHLRGSGNVSSLAIYPRTRLRGDNQLPVTLGTGTAQEPCLLQLETAAATVTRLEIGDVVMDDISSTGTKLCAVRNNGLIGTAHLKNVRLIDCSAGWRQLTNANTSLRLSLNDCEIDTTSGFTVTADVAIALTQMSNIRQTTGGNVFQVANSGTSRIELSNVVLASGGSVIRNATSAANLTVLMSNVSNASGNLIRSDASTPTISFAAVNSSAATPISVTAGTPVFRLVGDVSFSVDGTIIDATVTNHAAGAKFYNTNAAFGAGIGAYARGSAAWVRIAS